MVDFGYFYLNGKEAKTSNHNSPILFEVMKRNETKRNETEKRKLPSTVGTVVASSDGVIMLRRSRFIFKVHLAIRKSRMSNRTFIMEEKR
jgi:hypothetical protein